LLGEKDGVRGHTSIDMPAPWMERFKPEVGGYLVIYGDGYHSFSPGALVRGGLHHDRAAS
jgi:transcriptional regulator of nitric oxide reductase